MLLDSVSTSLRKSTKKRQKKIYIYILKTWLIFPINLISIWWQKTQAETLKGYSLGKKKYAQFLTHESTYFSKYFLNITHISIQ